MLQAQAHKSPLTGAIHFCHTSCVRAAPSRAARSPLICGLQFLFDGGSVQSYLSIVKTWLDANPDEVLTFIFTNPEGLDMATVWAPAFTGSGIAPYMYSPPAPPVAQGDWPTLGDMIGAGTRVVAFIDAGADSYAVPYLLPEFQMVRARAIRDHSLGC
jgi:hypothetical protein